MASLSTECMAKIWLRPRLGRPDGDEAWTSRLGCGAWVWSSTSRRSATTTSMPGCCRELTDEDLKEHRRRLGRPPPQAARGHRRPARSRGRRRTSSERAPQQAPAARPRPSAERRQLTVHVRRPGRLDGAVGRLDPEEMREVIRAYQNAVAGEIARFEGHVAKYMGDGVLAYFGYPRAHEDDAERAVLRRAERHPGGRRGCARPTASPWQRGSASPPAWWSSATSSARARRGRRRSSARRPTWPPGCRPWPRPAASSSARATRRLIGGAVRARGTRAAGAEGLRRAGAGVAGHRRRARSRAGSRRARRGLTPLVGREQEVALLLDRWQQAKDGEGQVVLLSRRAGHRQVADHPSCGRAGSTADPHIRLRYQCSPYYTTTAFHPFVEQLERAAGFARDDTASTQAGQAGGPAGAGDGARQLRWLR